MTFFHEFHADIRIWSILSDTVGSPAIRWSHNDSMYVRIGGIRNTKTWSRSSNADKCMESVDP